MKQLSICLYFICFYSCNIICQEFNRQEYFNSLKQDTIEFNKLFYQSVGAKTNKTNMFALLGNPDSIVAPNYECGGFSDINQEMKFYQYYYTSLNYIGAGENLILENMDFVKDTSVVLDYKGFKFNHNTRIEEFKLLFPKSFKNRYGVKNDYRIERIKILPELVSDDMLIFTFKNGLLVKYWYWSPC